MLAPSSGLLRAGLELKLNQVKRATGSYLRDRSHQATDTVTGYAVAAGLYAAAGVFLIAACLVGIAALFRWVEFTYGLFWAFGAVGALLVATAALCAGLAAIRMKRPAREFPSLASRLRVAVKANPIGTTPNDGTLSNDIRTMAPASQGRAGAVARPRNDLRNNLNLQLGLLAAATLLGWAATRRRQRARRTGL